MKNYDTTQHVRGESIFVDDVLQQEDTLYISVFASPVAHGQIKNLNLKNAFNVKGVKAIFTAKDITGENQIGGIIPDENLLAEDTVHFIGHPVALVVADDVITAKQAMKIISIDIEPLPVITDAREAFQKGELIIPPRIFELGNVNEVWGKCDFVIEGEADSGGQEHLYIETQGSYAFPVEGGGIKIISSTQSPTALQKATSKVLGIPMHKIEVDVMRLGGGFGGKEDQATAWGVMSALAAFLLKKPVKLILSRHDDIRFTGKRHPYSSDFKIGLTKEGKILAYQVEFFQNAGAAADLSPPVLDRTLFHCTNSYYIPNVKATGYCCRTNLPPNTAFRGFGGPQGMFVIESAIFKAAQVIGIDPSVIQEKNLLKDNDEFPYGQKVKSSTAVHCWTSAKDKFDFESLKKEVENFNAENSFVKKGIAFMPICFGISFTATYMNQASALVHIYTDGSVSVSTAAIEMGQGVNMKIRQVASNIFSLPLEMIKIESTNTTRIANTSPTAASSGADLNGNATKIACIALLERLKNVASEELNITEKSRITFLDEKILVDGKQTKLTWKHLISSAYLKRIGLSSHAFYSTPGIHFDKEKNKGEPFAYHVYGTAIIQSKVDCLRGTADIESVKVVHDFGKSINKVIDRGQAEGAIMQGIGWMTLEEVIYNKNGKLLTDTLSTYKVPDLHSTPKIIVEFLDTPFDSPAIFNSKAVGEPPLMYGIGAYFSILNAVKSFNKNIEAKFSTPFTNEKILMSLYEDTKKSKEQIK